MRDQAHPNGIAFRVPFYVLRGPAKTCFQYTCERPIDTSSAHSHPSMDSQNRKSTSQFMSPSAIHEGLQVKNQKTESPWPGIELGACSFVLRSLHALWNASHFCGSLTDQGDCSCNDCDLFNPLLELLAQPHQSIYSTSTK